MNPKSYLSSAERRTCMILDAYGSKMGAWPIDERQTTLDCLAKSPILQLYRKQIETLDLRIAAAQSEALLEHTELKALQQRILSNLPPQPHLPKNTCDSMRRPAFFNWLFRGRSIIALASLLLLVIILGQHHPSPVPPTSIPASASFAAWTWYDVTGQVLPTQHASSTVSMTELIEMEASRSGG